MTGSSPEFLRKFPLRPLSMRACLCDNEVKTGWWSTSAAELLKAQCNGVLTCLIGVSTIYVPKNSLPCPCPVSWVRHRLVVVLSRVLQLVCLRASTAYRCSEPWAALSCPLIATHLAPFPAKWCLWVAEFECCWWPRIKELYLGT